MFNDPVARRTFHAFQAKQRFDTIIYHTYYNSEAEGDCRGILYVVPPE